MESRGEALDIYHIEYSKAPSFTKVQLSWHKEKAKSEGSEVIQWIDMPISAYYLHIINNSTPCIGLKLIFN